MEYIKESGDTKEESCERGEREPAERGRFEMAQK
jgi:hypothetical protein